MTGNNTGQYEALLAQVRSHLHSPTEDGLAEASSLLDEVGRLGIGDPEEIQALRKRLAEGQKLLRAKREYDDTLARCQQLWSQEQEFLRSKASPDQILQHVYQAALSLAENAHAKYPDFLLFQGLCNDARIRYEAAKQRYQIRTTALQTRNYKAQIEALEAEEDKERELPWYDEKGQYVGSRKVREALEELIREARTYASNKAREYLSTAEEWLDRFQPRLAREVIEKSSELYLLPKEDADRLQKIRQERIQPLLQKLEEAEKLAYQAEASQDLSMAWKMLEEAVAIYPHAPNLQEARKTLLNRTLRDIEFRLQQVRRQYEAFCQNNPTDIQKAVQEVQSLQALHQQVEAAQRTMDGYIEMLQRDIQVPVQKRDTLRMTDANNPLLSILDERIGEQERLLAELRRYLAENRNHHARLKEEWEELSQHIQEAVWYQSALDKQYAEIERVLKNHPEKAWQTLQDFLQEFDSEDYRSRYGEARRRLPRLRTIEMQIAAYKDFLSVLRDLEDIFLSNDLERIEQATHDAKALAEKQTDDERRKKIDEMVRKLQGRAYFLRGQQAWRDGDLKVAHDLLQRVRAIPHHPDGTEARTILAEIEARRKQEQEIESRLREAQDLLDRLPSRAYESLRDLAERPSSFRSEINRLLDEARQKWETDLLDRLDKAMQSQSPSAEDLHTFADQLLSLPEPRSPASNQKARRAKARAYAIEARIHQRAYRLKEALIAWNQARQLDPMTSEYDEQWRHIRLALARQALEDSYIGENEILGILRGIQNDLPDEPQVALLAIEQYYRLSRLEKIDLTRRLEYLERAEYEAKHVCETVDLSAAEQGRLKDLLQHISVGKRILKQYIELEQRLRDAGSLEDFSNVLNMKEDLRREVAGDQVLRRQLDTWWKQLQQEIVEHLERLDAAAGINEESEERFEIRGKIALLDSGHRLARMVGPAIIRHVEYLWREIDTVLNDYRGIHIEASDADRVRVSPLDLVYMQQIKLDRLGRQSDMWYNLLQRFERQVGVDAERLRSGLRERRTRLTEWQGSIAAFYRNIRSLSYELSVARRDNDWQRFDTILADINKAGFGDHRATRQIVAEKDRIQARYRYLMQMCDNVRKAMSDPHGTGLLHAQQVLQNLRAEDPDDEFGLQESLRIPIPWAGQQVLQGVDEIQRWLEQQVEQIRQFGNWLYRTGAQRIWPPAFAVIIQESSQECANLDEIRQDIGRLQDKGKFRIAHLLLDLVISGSSADELAQYDQGRLFQEYRVYLPLEVALKRLDEVPFAVQSLVPFLRDLLDELEKIRITFQQQLEQARTMQRQLKKKEEEWQEASLELEQALAELQHLETGVLAMFRQEEIKRARLRYQEALARCKEIAPRHPLLEGLE